MFSVPPLPSLLLLNNHVNNKRSNQLSKLFANSQKQSFPVYLVHCEAVNQQFAMKVFPYKDGKVSSCFLTEARFSKLNHQNVIKTIGYEQNQETMSNDKVVKISYLITEFAPNGDFHDVVVMKKSYD